MAALAGLVDDILAQTAPLHPDEALLLLNPLWAKAGSGLARRALLAARVAVMRQAMVASPLVQVVAEPAPVAVAEPAAEPAVFVPVPPPRPAPVNRAALVALTLEDAARLLMAVGANGSDDADAPEAAVAAMPDAVPEPVASPDDTGMVVAPPEASATRAKPRKARAKPVMADAATDAPAVSPVADPPAAAPPVTFDLASQFAAMAADEIVTGADTVAPAVPVAKGGRAITVDLSAQFAAMED